MIGLALAATTSAWAQTQYQSRQTPPIKLGCSGGENNDASSIYCCGGTLGALVIRDGVPCILSNNHVLARSGSATQGDDTIQPGLIDVGCRAANAQVVGDFAGNLVPLGTANVDTALSIVRPGMVDSNGFILGIGVPCASTQNAALNMPVIKSGRTTGTTTGTVTSLNTSVSIQYQKGCNSGKRFTISFTNQVVTTAMSAGGDSGSVLLSNDGTLNPVGLLFAGSSSVTIYNPIQSVVNAYTAGGHSFAFVGNTCSGFVADPVPPGPAQAEFDRALAVKVEHEDEIMKLDGVCGVGVGCDADVVTKAAIVVYMQKPKQDAQPGPAPAPKLAKSYDGIPVRVIYTEPFVAQ